MSSYFDLPPRGSKAAAPAALEANVKDIGTPGRYGLMTPQISTILDDMELEDKSDSEDDETNVSDDNSTSDKNTENQRPTHQADKTKLTNSDLRKAATSPLPSASDKHGPKTSSSGLRPGPKGAHLARFQSLRTMLFSSHIQDNMEKQKEQQKKEEAEQKWKQDHENRKGYERPKTPEKEKDEKERGVLRRMGSKLKRLGSKDVATMGTLKEGEVADHVSTASSDNDDDAARRGSEDMNDSDIEDLKRWISRRDPPSDGEARLKSKIQLQNTSTQVMQPSKESTESGHESLGNSDVDGLVQWVNRKEEQRTPSHQQPSPKEAASAIGTEKDKTLSGRDYSSVSTESDSEFEPARKQTMNDDDVDDLVRWISHKEGPIAGPVRNSGSPSSSKSQPRKQTQLNTELSSTGSSHSQSSSSDEGDDTAELMSWVTRKNKPSGESDGADKSATSSPLPQSDQLSPETESEPKSLTNRGKSATLTGDDVDDLVQWVSKKNAEGKDGGKDGTLSGLSGGGGKIAAV
jgi:hypothetical protein